MATRLSDSEFAERARAGNRQRALQRRTRLSRSGYQQLLVWMPGDLRNQIDRIAADRGTSVTDATTEIVRAGIAALTAPPLPVVNNIIAAQTAPESLPLFEPAFTEQETGSLSVVTQSAPGALAERDDLIVALRRQGKSLGQIAAALAEQGILTSKGNPLSRDTVNQAIKRAGLVDKKENELDR